MRAEHARLWNGERGQGKVKPNKTVMQVRDNNSKLNDCCYAAPPHA